MPTNVPPQYREVENRYRAATDPEEKLACLEEMLRIMPKHKGTDKLQADVKARIAKLRKDRGKKGASTGPSHMVPREGAGQVALLGPPNAGKSALVAALTHAQPKVAEYPFTTREPVPGMMVFEDVKIQLIDLPPISDEHTEPWIYDAVRRADLVWLVVDNGGALDGLELVDRLVLPKHIGLIAPGAEPDYEDKPLGWLPKETLLVITGSDREDAAENLEIFRELASPVFPVLSVSSVTGEGADALRRETFLALGVIRVYTKEPGKEPDRESPFTLKHGATVDDLARAIHREVAASLKFARIWGPGVFDGQPVQKDHVLEEGNVVELHHA
jgi:ribosome-interacting GTPase 1